jgi:hypothetical protein
MSSSIYTYCCHEAVCGPVIDNFWPESFRDYCGIFMKLALISSYESDYVQLLSYT